LLPAPRALGETTRQAERRDRACEFIGAETLKTRRELLGGYGDKKAIEVVRILVEEPTRRRPSISELVELRDEQRSGTATFTVIARSSCGSNARTTTGA